MIQRFTDEHVRLIRIALNPKTTPLSLLDVSWVVHAHLLAAGGDNSRASHIRESIHRANWAWNIEDSAHPAEVAEVLTKATLELSIDDRGRQVCAAVLHSQAWKRVRCSKAATRVCLLLKAELEGVLEDERHRLYLARWKRLCRPAFPSEPEAEALTKPKSELVKAIEAVIEADPKDQIDAYQRVISLYVTQPTKEARRQIERAVDAFGFRTKTICQPIQRAGGDGFKDTKGYVALELPLPVRPRALPVKEIVGTLRNEFPWLTHIINAVELDLLIASRFLAGIPALTPRLLEGPPGCGKTSFCHRLFELLGAPSALLNAAGASSPRLIVGTARGWSNHRPCLALEQMVHARRAQCSLIVDELEKESQSGSNGRLSDGLLGFLEPVSSQRHFDECLLTNADVSDVNWIATSNDVRPIPAPVVSRFQVLTCDQPSAEHMPSIMESTLAAMRRRFRIPEGHPILDDRGRAELDTQVPRMKSARSCAQLVRMKVSESLRRELRPVSADGRDITAAMRMH